MSRSTTITSRDNALLRLARATRDGRETDLIYIEGLRLCEEAVRSGLDVHAMIYSDQIEQKERASAFLSSIKSAERMASVSEKLLATISYTKTPQGIVALARRPKTTERRLAEWISDLPLLVLIHGLNNPVNVGAVLRSAEAAGATGVIATQHTSDPFSPKSLRGAMGSAFRLPIWIGPTYAEALDWCNRKQIQTVAADIDGTANYTEVDWRGPRALVLGPEATGLTSDEINAADESVKIPMLGEVESLNVSVAAGVILYEAARQRRG